MAATMVNVMARFGIVAVVLCALLLVAGCGRKGPLELPPERPGLVGDQG